MANVTAKKMTEHAARDAWEAFLRQHPRMYGVLSIVSSFLGYFLNGHAIVALVQWMVRVAGRIAESALLLATLYVTLNNVAHTLITWILPAQAIDLLNYLSLVAFSLLPELIVAAAITVTLDHWSMLVRDWTWRNPAWVWATLYSIPTVTFLVMTVTTLASFVQIEAASANPVQATGAALTARFLAGWSYSLIEILFATIGKKSYTATLDHLRAMVATQGQELSLLRATEQEARATANRLRATVNELTGERESQQQRATVALRELHIAQETIAYVQEEKVTLQHTLEEAIQEGERLRERLQRVKAREDRRAVALANLATTAPVQSPERATADQLRRREEGPHTGYVAIDDGQTIAIANGHGATITATGSHRDRIKEAMLRAMHGGHPINLKVIAETTGAGYSTVKKWKQDILEEIAREQTGDGEDNR